MAPDELDGLNLKELREQGEPLGLKFKPGTSKKDAAQQIRDARAAADPTIDTSGTPPVAPTPPTPDKQDVKAGKKLTIERENERAWWCPICDHSMAQTEPQCGGCKAERGADKVIANG